MRDASRLFIATDANAEGLLEAAWKAARKPTRGGIPNLICIAEPLYILAKELGNVAERVTVILPWGSLLRAVAAPEVASLWQIASLCSAGASVEIVFSYDPQRDAEEGARLGIGQLSAEYMYSTLPEPYQQAGLHIVSAEKIPQQELPMYETTWAKRLASGRSRDVWRLRAIR
jgi:16S rRNA (adenine(1408)-N(1))-methyltransferase